jgi:hypothetical protein
MRWQQLNYLRKGVHRHTDIVRDFGYQIGRDNDLIVSVDEMLPLVVDIFSFGRKGK